MAAVLTDQIHLVDLLEFNRQIEGMLAAGIPLSWQGDDSPAVLRKESDRVAKEIAILVGQGKSFLDAWQLAPDVSLPYKAAFMGWAISDRSPKAFDLLKANTVRLPQSRRLWFLNFQLGIIFLLGIGVLAIWLSVGRMSILYENSNLKTGPLSRFLELLQQKPIYSLAGVFVVLTAWGYILHLAKTWISKLSQSFSKNDARARRNWIESAFLKLGNKDQTRLVGATKIFESFVLLQHANQAERTPASELPPPLSVERKDGDEKRSWAAFPSNILWSAEKAVENRLVYRVSTLPYTMYFIGGGFVVFGVGILMFGPLIELLYATVVPGAFSK